MKTKKIKDCLPLVNGLWTHINYDFPDIFDIEPSQLDILFLSNWSMRTAAPIMNVIHSDEYTSMLNDEELTNLAGIVNGMYKHKWDKLMAVALAEYDPIHNYSDHLIETVEYSEGVDGTKSASGSNSSTRTDNLTRTESGGRGYTDTYNVTDTETDNLSTSNSKTGSENLTDTRSSTETRNLSNTGSNSSAENIFGFNSSTAVGDKTGSGSNSGSETGTIGISHTGGTSTGTIESGSETKTGTVTNAKTGTEGRSYSGTLTEENTGTQGNIGSSTNSETTSNDTEGERTREYTKTGNIGNISTQKLLNEELDLWKYNFICEIMRDVVGLITLPIYEQ